jgi:NSS family neurotransmitter:Na+ symporter
MGPIAGRIIGLLFFLMVGFAALTSCISVMETIVSNCMEIFKISRKKLTAILLVIYSLASIVICLGYNHLYFEIKLPNGSIGQILDIMDYISNSFLMPLISFLSSILIGWVLGPKWITDEVTKNGEKFPRRKIYVIMIKYIAPIIMFILFLQSIGLFDL